MVRIGGVAVRGISFHGDKFIVRLRWAVCHRPNTWKPAAGAGGADRFVYVCVRESDREGWASPDVPLP